MGYRKLSFMFCGLGLFVNRMLVAPPYLDSAVFRNDFVRNSSIKI